MRLRVSITRDDIRLGKPRTYCDCAAAIAIRRTLERAGVSKAHVAIHGHICLGRQYAPKRIAAIRLAISERLWGFIETFDWDTKRAKPMMFSITIPDDKIEEWRKAS